MPCAANNAATLRLQRCFCRKNQTASTSEQASASQAPHRLRSVPFRLSGSVSLVLAPCHSAFHSAPPYPFPPHPAPPAHSLLRTFPPPLSVPSRSARLNPLLPVHSRSVIHPAPPTEIIHRKSRKMRRFFCFFISSPRICPTNKIIPFNTYPFITDRTN